MFKNTKILVASFWLAPVIGLPMIALAQDQVPADQSEKTASEEKWNAKFQATYLGQSKRSFNAPYSGANSLIPAREHAYSSTITAYLGYRPWAGGSSSSTLK